MKTTIALIIILGSLALIYKYRVNVAAQQNYKRRLYGLLVENSERLDQAIDYLHSRVGILDILLRGEYIVPQRIADGMSDNSYGENSIQELLNDMLSFIGWGSKKVKLVVHDQKGLGLSGFHGELNSANREVPGFYRWKGSGLAEIHVFLHNIHDKTSGVAAVLAHECAHYFLNTLKVGYDDEEANEILTDVTAIYLGFAPLLTRGYQTYSKVWHYMNHSFRYSSRIGYLKPLEVAYTHLTVEQLRAKENLRKRKAEIDKQKALDFQNVKEKLFRRLAFIEEMYSYNQDGLRVLTAMSQEGKVTFTRQEAATVMANHNAVTFEAVASDIARLKKYLEDSSILDDITCFKVEAEIDTLGATITEWNSVLHRYI